MSRLVALCFSAVALGVLAQDSPVPVAKSNAKDLLPRPAEMAKLASKSLLLGIAAAGDALVAVGDRGVILRSTDGTSWQQVASPVHATLTAVAFADAKTGWAVGHDAAILHTVDGGASWALQNFTPTDSKPLLTVLALDAQHAMAAGAYGLFLSTIDGGKSWSPVAAPAIRDDGLHLNALVELASGSAFLAGETGLLGVSTGPADWKRLTPPYQGSMFGALPRGDNGALVYGLRGNAYLTDDVRGGKWRKVETGTVQSLFGGTVLENGDAVLVGADGAMLRVGADGKVTPLSAAAGAGTLSGVLARGSAFVVVGENGAATVQP